MERKEIKLKLIEMQKSLVEQEYIKKEKDFYYNREPTKCLVCDNTYLSYPTDKIFNPVSGKHEWKYTMFGNCLNHEGLERLY